MRQALYPRQPHPIPRAVRRPRIVGALLWLMHLLLVQPIGRRAREDRLGALDDMTLQDIGLKRADLHAAAWGIVALGEAVPDSPSARPLVACRRQGRPRALADLREAA